MLHNVHTELEHQGLARGPAGPNIPSGHVPSARGPAIPLYPQSSYSVRVKSAYVIPVPQRIMRTDGRIPIVDSSPRPSPECHGCHTQLIHHDHFFEEIGGNSVQRVASLLKKGHPLSRVAQITLVSSSGGCYLSNHTCSKRLA